MSSHLPDSAFAPPRIPRPGSNVAAPTRLLRQGDPSTAPRAIPNTSPSIRPHTHSSLVRQQNPDVTAPLNQAFISHSRKHIMKQTIPIAAILVVAAVASPALAGEFEYNYLEAGWVQSKINSPDNSTANGAGISGSAALGDYAHIFGDYAYQEFGHALDIYTYEAGGGFNQGSVTGSTFWERPPTSTVRQTMRPAGLRSARMVGPSRCCCVTGSLSLSKSTAASSTRI